MRYMEDSVHFNIFRPTYMKLNNFPERGLFK